MKITPVFQAAKFLNRVNEKSDGDKQSRNPYQQQENASRHQQEQGDAPERSEEELQAAVDAFQKDEHAQASGLSAEVAGQGPGLKVTLKDGNGGVVRQFTGEEFLRLREASARDGRTRGKILDQKL